MVPLWLQRRGRVLMLAAGGALTLLALTVDLLRLGRWHRMGLGQAVAIAAGLGLLGISWWLRPQYWQSWRALGRRLRSFYVGLAVVALNTVLLLLALEVASQFALRQDLFSAGVSAVEPAGKETPSWTDTYWREHEATGRKRYAPYLLWRTPSFAGETINVNSAGQRQTPGAVCEADTYRVFTFGGSAMWGHGVPDWETIPAHLQVGLAAQREEPVCVQNFAERGYVATQGVVALSLALQEGNVPDLVIFYDGANDLAAAVQPDGVGAHLSLEEIRTRFEQPWLGALSHSYTLQLAQQLAASAGSPMAPAQQEQLSQRVVERYRGAYELVAALADAYGFSYAFFWQPLISVGEQSLTGPERVLADAFPAELDAYYEMSYAQAATLREELPHFYYLGDIFEDKTVPVWLDPVHLLPAGNRMVAGRMVDVIAAE